MGRVTSGRVVLLLVSSWAFVVLAVNQKGNSGAKPINTAEPPTTPKVPQPRDINEMMETTDYVRSGAMIVGFLAVNFAGRDTWMLAQFIIHLAFGSVYFFFPDAIIDYETDGKLDAIHLLYAQVFGANLVGMGITIYASRESRDRSVGGSILMSQILGGVVLLQAMFIDNMKSKGDKQRWNDKHLSFGALSVGLWLLGSLYQYLRGPSYGSSGIDLRERLTKHLLFDLLILMPIGLFYFAFPDAVLSMLSMKGFVPDGIHVHLIRVNGALLFISALHCHSAMGFSDDIDKRAHLIGRLVSGMLIFPALCLYQYKYIVFGMNVFYVGTAIHVLCFANLLCAYFIRSKTKAH